MGSHKAKVRFVVYRDYDEWVLCDDLVEVQIFCDEFIYSCDSLELSSRIICEAVCGEDIKIIMEGVLSNAMDKEQKLFVIPQQAYEVFGDFVVTWEQSDSYYEPWEWDCEYWFEESFVKRIPYSFAKELGLYCVKPISIQCA